MNRSLDVLLNEVPQGTLSLTPAGVWQIDFLPNAERLSLSFGQSTTVSGWVVQNWFENLLPEGQERLAAERRLGVRHNETFDLLTKMGWDLAGAVQVGERPLTSIQPAMSLSDVLASAVANYQPDPYRHPTPPSVAGVVERFSLAGAQTKVGVVPDGLGGWTTPAADGASTHIFKPEFSKWQGIAIAEVFGQQLARAVGLQAAQAQLMFVDGIPGVLIARYDRVVEPNGHIKRLHQEDLCQALGIGAGAKYDVLNTPSRISEFCRVARHNKMADVVINFQKGLLFQYLLGNADAHLKNFSLLFHNNNNVKLAPLYDSVPTAWFETSRLPALHLGQASQLVEATQADWEELADEFGVSKKSLIKTRDELAQMMANELPGVVQQLDVALSGSTASLRAVDEQRQKLQEGVSILVQTLPPPNLKKFIKKRRL